MKNEMENDLNRALMLDGNAAAGLLQRCFGTDVTASLVQCDGCGREGLLGDVRAYTQAPGLILRCKHCEALHAALGEEAKRTLPEGNVEPLLGVAGEEPEEEMALTRSRRRVR